MDELVSPSSDIDMDFKHEDMINFMSRTSGPQNEKAT